MTKIQQAEELEAQAALLVSATSGWSMKSEAMYEEAATLRAVATTEQRITAALRLAESVCDQARRSVEAARAERDRQTEIAELGEEIVAALHDESDGIGAPAGMPHRLRSRFLCVRDRAVEAKTTRDRLALVAGGEVA